MRIQRAPMFVALVVLGTSAGASGTKVWEFGESSPRMPSPLPIRVHRVNYGLIRVFEKSGRASEVLSVRSRSTGMADVEAFHIAKQRLSEGTDCGRFTGEGTIAFFSSNREGGPFYARRFDVDQRMFLGTPLIVEHVVNFKAGPRVVAVFTEGGPHKGDLDTPQDELRIGVVTQDGNECKLNTRWENRSYTHAIALDSNEAGDVVALVGKCEGGLIRLDCASYLLVVSKSNGTVLEREIPGATLGSHVAISESGEWAAAELGHRVATYQLSKAAIEERPSMRLGECGVGIDCLSISDDSAIVGVVISKGRIDVVYGRPGGICEVVTSYQATEPLEAEARFFEKDLFYVATMAPSDAAKSGLAIFKY
jgi:hypothetical protein